MSKHIPLTLIRQLLINKCYELDCWAGVDNFCDQIDKLISEIEITKKDLKQKKEIDSDNLHK